MSNIMVDIGMAVEQYWQEKFGDNVVIHLASPDERVVNTQDSELTFPRVAMSFIGVAPDSSRRYGGVLKQVETDTEAGTATLTDPPTPINIDIQMDLLATTRLSMFDLQQTVLQVLGAHFREPIYTTEDRKITITPLPDGYDFGDRNNDGLWRSVYRFRIETWLESLSEAEEVSIVLTRIFEINQQTIQVTEEVE